MNAPDRLPLPDVQSMPDTRGVAINRVGVKGVRHPLAVAMPEGGHQRTVASIDMYVGLPAHAKGTHMSRFLEVLLAHEAPLAGATARELMARMLARLEAETGYIEARFPYFVEKRAPVSGVSSPLDYDVRLSVHATGAAPACVTLEVAVPVTSLCPCSREISEYGAHNQRSRITISADVGSDLTVEDLIRVAEAAASCEIWGLLKRADEKHVTERAYDNPKFVEDIVRDIAVRLDADERIAAYRVESENYESIHNHSAYALVERDKRTRL